MVARKFNQSSDSLVAYATPRGKLKGGVQDGETPLAAINLSRPMMLIPHLALEGCAPVYAPRQPRTCHNQWDPGLAWRYWGAYDRFIASSKAFGGYRPIHSWGIYVGPRDRPPALLSNLFVGGATQILGGRIGPVVAATPTVNLRIQPPSLAARFPNADGVTAPRHPNVLAHPARAWYAAPPGGVMHADGDISVVMPGGGLQRIGLGSVQNGVGADWQNKICAAHAAIEFASHPEMMAAHADGGLEFYAMYSHLDDRLGVAAPGVALPVTPGHAFYEIFDTLTVGDRDDVVCRALVGFLAGFPQQRTEAADYQDPAGTTIIAGRDSPARSRHMHYIAVFHRARIGGDRAAHDALDGFFRLLMLSGKGSDWQVLSNAPAMGSATINAARIDGGGSYKSLVDNLVHAVSYILVPWQESFANTRVDWLLYDNEEAFLQQIRFQPCLSRTALRGLNTGPFANRRGGYGRLAMIHIWERCQAPTAIPIAVSDEQMLDLQLGRTIKKPGRNGLP